VVERLLEVGTRFSGRGRCRCGEEDAVERLK